MSSVHAGVYIHVPYCRRRCSYCDFYFEVRPADAGYEGAVRAELAARAQAITGPAQSLSFGGGTPTALPIEVLGRLVAEVRRVVGLTPDAEISLEANPEDLAHADAAARLRDAGFTRVSVGLQSFDDAVLSFLGRAHDGASGARAVMSLVATGLDVGVDLIIGVPGEDDARLARDIERAAALGVVHVSTYMLTVEHGTPLERLVQIGKRAPVDDDAQASAYERAQALLAGAGYRQYEISSHARPGHESRHNRLYWAHAPYLGLGPGAHSMRLLPGGGVERRHTTARLDAWMADPVSAAHELDVLEPAHALREAVAFGLRDLEAGVDLPTLARLHQLGDGGPAAAVRAVLEAARVRGDVRQRDDRYILTPTGARFADRVARDVLGSDVTNVRDVQGVASGNVLASAAVRR